MIGAAAELAFDITDATALSPALAKLEAPDPMILAPTPASDVAFDASDFTILAPAPAALVSFPSTSCARLDSLGS
jgi:hypothetical protein